MFIKVLVNTKIIFYIKYEFVNTKCACTRASLLANVLVVWVMIGGTDALI